MKKVIYIWNRLYYGLFFYYSWVQVLFYKIFWAIPINFLCDLGILNKKKHSRLNTEVARSLTDEKISIVVLISDATILAFTALIVWTIANFSSLLIPRLSLVFLNRSPFILITSILVMPMNYFILWRKNRYLEYFKKFHNSTPLRNWIWSAISISAILFALLLFILSLHLM